MARIFVKSALVCVAACGLAAADKPKQLSENEKIEALIASVAAQKGAIFIRNGVEYDAKSAAKHLRSKRRWAGSKIKTAKDFIEKLATGSSQTGKPYTIRLKSGKEMPSAEFLEEELDRLEGKRRASNSEARQ